MIGAVQVAAIRAATRIPAQTDGTRTAAALVLTLALAVAGLGVSCRAKPESPFLREFAGSYPVDPRPNGTLKMFQLTAAETDLPLLDGRHIEWTINERAFEGHDPFDVQSEAV